MSDSDPMLNNAEVAISNSTMQQGKHLKMLNKCSKSIDQLNSHPRIDRMHWRPTESTELEQKEKWFYVSNQLICIVMHSNWEKLKNKLACRWTSGFSNRCSSKISNSIPARNWTYMCKPRNASNRKWSKKSYRYKIQLLF